MVLVLVMAVLFGVVSCVDVADGFVGDSVGGLGSNPPSVLPYPPPFPVAAHMT